MRFSNETGCFYPEDQEYATLPGDLQTVPDDDYHLVQNRELGKLYRVEDNRMVIYDAPPLPLTDYIEIYCNQLDDLAEACRQAAIVNDLRAVEYEYTTSSALEYKNANYAGVVPAAVQSWADAAGKTPQEACDDILERRRQYLDALLTIRDQRLRGKALIRQQTTLDDIISTYSGFAEILDLVKQAVANI